jgi:glycosyltransferase involved in cell wall biosynthesis
LISFIIPAYNEERHLPATLRSIREAMRSLGEPGLAEREPYEIIVADDASTDATVKIAESLGARIAKAGAHKISATRNAGAKAALGEFYFFVDADTQVNADLIRDALAEMRGEKPRVGRGAGSRGGPAAGGGAGARFDGRVPVYAAILNLALHAVQNVGKLAFGCFVFCRKDAFEATGGFDERYYAAEEWAFSRALARHGRVVILRGKVLTSGRKLRTHSAWEILSVFGSFALRGWGSLRKARGTDLWYGTRREDPEKPGA